MNNQCFSIKLFVLWVAYGVICSIIIFIACYHVIGGEDFILPTGRNVGMFISGHAVFGICTIGANVLLAYRFNSLDWGAFVTLIIGVVCYFFVFWFENEFLWFPEIFGSFPIEFGNLLNWLSFAFCVMSVIAVEHAYRNISYRKKLE